VSKNENRHPYGRPLPAVLAEIAEAVGEAGGLEAALKLSERRGATLLEIARDGELLPSIVGTEAAARIVDRLGVGARIYVPLADYHLFRWLHAQGVGRAEIARRLRIPIRTQQRWLAAHDDREQLSLKLL
jgi:hypothetical protein